MRLPDASQRESTLPIEVVRMLEEQRSVSGAVAQVESVGLTGWWAVSWITVVAMCRWAL